MSQASYKRSRSRRKSKKKQSSFLNRNWVIALFALILLVGGITFVANRSSSATQTASAGNVPAASSNSDNPYAGIPGPNDWTEETAVEIYNRRNGQWDSKTYGDVEPDTEFIVGDYLYATTPEKGSLFLKPEIDINLLAETDRAFDPDNWRMPKPDDVVFLFRSSSNQQKGHWLLKHVQPDSEIVFQGKGWSWELDLVKQGFVVKDTGNVLAKVTATHKEVHQGDVLALTVQYEVCGKLGLITGSEEHPFYVLEKEDYLPMVELLPGMALKTDNGAQATVVELKSLPEAMALYNLTVENVHNYYIYSSEDEPGLLVHNVNCKQLQRIMDKYPLGNHCEKCAGEIYDIFKAEGASPQIGRIETNTPTLGLADGRRVSDNPNPFHEFVQVGDTVYNSITGPNGCI